MSLHQSRSDSDISPISVEIQSTTSPALYAVISLNRPPVNALVLAITEGIISAIDELESNSNVQGFILTSSIDGFFSAGIDLSLFVGNVEDFERFYLSLRRMFLRIYESRLVSIACIQGHMLAGGNILALPCHYRFMLKGKSKIGLNEVAVGIPVPRWLSGIFAQTVGNLHSERLLPLGTIFNVEKAKNIGLVDEVFGTLDLMKEAAVAQLEHCFRVNQQVRHKTLLWIRRDFAEKMRREEALDLAAIREDGQSPVFQKTIRKVIESLSEKSTKPKSKL